MAAIAVHFGRLDVSFDEQVELANLLDEDEKVRADRFQFDRDRRRFVVRRGKLRQWLAAAVGGSAARLDFAITPHGKPALSCGPYFSVSHSRETMMLAIGDNELGCDIEVIDHALDWQPLAHAFFSTEEIVALDALGDTAATNAFFACWTRKEAFVKAIGRGLAYPLDAFSVSVGCEPAILSGGDGWLAHEVVELEGHQTALVAKLN